jgi:plastocyanin
MRRLLPVLILFVLLFVGCGGNDDSSSSPADHTVTMTDYAFNPSELTVRRGQTINVVNDGGIAHNLKIEKGPDGRKETQELAGTDTFLPKDSQRLTINLPPGRYAMVCSVPGIASWE